MTKTPEQYLEEPYSRILTPNGDGSYAAEILEFEGCYAEGNTPNEAISNLEKTARSWIEANLSHGHVIPEPFDNQDYAGRVLLRLPRSYHRQASKMAERDGISLNQFLVTAIGEKIGATNLFANLMFRLEQKMSTSTLHIHFTEFVTTPNRPTTQLAPATIQLSSGFVVKSTSLEQQHA